MTDNSLVFPEGFDDYSFEVESKGWFPGATFSFLGKKYRLTFYDPARLRQVIEHELQGGSFFFEPNLVVVPSVTRQNMEKAVKALIQSGEVSALSAE
jgi:hypothetical protein